MPQECFRCFQTCCFCVSNIASLLKLPLLDALYAGNPQRWARVSTLLYLFFFACSSSPSLLYLPFLACLCLPAYLCMLFSVWSSLPAGLLCLNFLISFLSPLLAPPPSLFSSLQRGLL